MTTHILLRGDPMDPQDTDLIAQFKTLPVGEPVPSLHWTVLDGNMHNSEIARFVFRYQLTEEEAMT